MRQKQWKDLTDAQQRSLVLMGALQLALLAAARNRHGPRGRAGTENTNKRERVTGKDGGFCKTPQKGKIRLRPLQA